MHASNLVGPKKTCYRKAGVDGNYSRLYVGCDKHVETIRYGHANLLGGLKYIQ
jgi:hypothetical protein